MGIKDLCQFLKKHEPDINVEVPLTSFSGQRLAIDASVYLYKFICIDNQMKGQWLDMFINFIVWFRNFNIRPVFVFDGQAPPQKERTQLGRREIRAKTKLKVDELQELMDILAGFENDCTLPTGIKDRIDKALGIDTACWSRIEVKMDLLERFRKENSKVISFTPADIRRVQDLLDYLGLPWFKATGEAEKTCAWMCRWGYVSGVVTTDSDVLAYGCPIFIRDVKVNHNECTLIRYEDALEVTDFTPDQFRDFCIMCGTDYNNRVPGYGPKKCFDLLQKYGDLETISETDIDLTNLFYEEGRELFGMPGRDQAEEMVEGYFGELVFPRIKKIDRGNLLMFLIKSNSHYTVDEIEAWNYKPKFSVQ